MSIINSEIKWYQIRKRAIRKFFFITFVIPTQKAKADTFLRPKWIRETLLLYKIYKHLFPEKQLTDFLLEPLNKIRTYINGSDEYYNRVKHAWIKYFCHSGNRVKMFITKLFFLLDIMDDEISKAILDFAMQTKNKEYRFWTTMDMSFATFATQKGLIDNFYTTRKELLKKIATEGNFKFKNIQHGKEIKKICIVTYHLQPTMKNSLFRVTKMIVDGMKKHFDEIYVGALDTFLIAPNDNFLSTISCFKEFKSKDYDFDNKRLLGENINTFYAEGLTYHDKMQNFITKLYSINPDIIIDVSDECSALSYYYSKDFFTLYIPLRSRGPSSFFTVLSGEKWQYEKSPNNDPFIDLSKLAGWRFPQFIPSMQGNYTKSELNLSEDSFVIVTAAYCSRNVSNSFLDNIAQLLLKNDRMVWLIVADDIPEYMRRKYPLLINNSKVMTRGFDPNLYALYKNCDVLLRTDTTGGSGSTAVAALAGLPIVMTDYECDPMSWLGNDYSLLHTSEELTREIEKLYTDNLYYIEKSNKVRSLIAKDLNSQECWDRLFEILKALKNKYDM